ncbi:STAS domain-containing protein [Actinomadura sp. NPDC047616]|uniref:STAS domain-containing protein n=1 Tax=Actinomadura sp. NPDC047616 TaxID=3155914 RepID=UPI0033CF1FB6
MTTTSPHRGMGPASRRPFDAGSAVAPLTIAERRHGRWSVLTVRGELEMTTADRLLDAVKDRLAATEHAGETPRMVLDVSGLSFCDSSGLNALVRGWHLSRQADGELVLLNPSAQLTRMLTITGLDRRLPIHDRFPD